MRSCGTEPVCVMFLKNLFDDMQMDDMQMMVDAGSSFSLMRAAGPARAHRIPVAADRCSLVHLTGDR